MPLTALNTTLVRFASMSAPSFGGLDFCWKHAESMNQEPSSDCERG